MITKELPNGTYRKDAGGLYHYKISGDKCMVVEMLERVPIVSISLKKFNAESMERTVESTCEEFNKAYIQALKSIMSF